MKEAVVLEKNRLKFFPVMMFSIVMGMGGVTMMYQKASLWLGFSPVMGSFFLGITTLLFAIVAMVYGIKAVTYFPIVQKEFSHPVRLNFFAAISISLLMLAMMYKESYEPLSTFFWYIGTAIHFYLTLHTISFWINHNQLLEHSNPAWFLPIVGNVLVPIGGFGVVSQSVLVYFLSVGLFFWIILFAILLNRIIFHHQLPQKFMPTLFIFIAPPAVGFLSYVKLFERIDTFALILFNLALFFTFLVAFMYKHFVRLNFFISWWAFVFPLTAMAMSAMLLYHHTHESMMLVLSYGMIILSSCVTVVVGYQTVKHVLRGEICVQEG